MKMTNPHNRAIYHLWAPIYDATVNHIFMPGRRQAMRALALQPGETVLLVGVGTGADLPLLPAGVRAVGVDLSPDMLGKARRKLPLAERQVLLVQGDAQNPLAQDGAFDAVIFHLILSVIPDGGACLRAGLRALKPGGRGVVFDKFLPDGRHPGLVRRVLNRFSTLLGTDITRRLGDMLAGSGAVALSDAPSIAGGTYRVVLLKKGLD